MPKRTYDIRTIFSSRVVESLEEKQKGPKEAFCILTEERVLCGRFSSAVPPSFPVMEEARSLEAIVASTGSHFGLTHTCFFPFQAHRRSDRISYPLTC